MHLTQIEVECYAGAKADETPRRFNLEGQTFEVGEVLDRWYQIESKPEWPRADYFKVRAVSQIARLVDESPSGVTDDLSHLFCSLKHTEYNAIVKPARCRACGFEFSKEKLTKPSKCPECHSTWILEPKIAIQRKNLAGERPST